MASIGQRLKPSHEKSDSEALEDLSSAFHDLDIDGEGLLDQASFLTALRMLGVNLPSTELEEIFRILDEDDTGMISYDKLQSFMKIGKIPSSLLSKIKSTGGPTTKRTSVIFGAGPMNLNQNKKNIKYSNGGLLAVVSESSPTLPNGNDEPMDKERVKMIQRAVIVIKKAMMKNISRKEVMEFLGDKGMDRDDIELAYAKASEQVMSPEEKLKYYTDLSRSKELEVAEQKKINDYFSQTMKVQSEEIQLLRDLLKIASDTLVNTFPNKLNELVSTQAANELTNRIQQATKDVKEAEEQKDDQSGIIHKRDLESLQMISQCVTNQQHFHANLYLHQLEPVIRDGLPNLTGFLSDFEIPDNNIGQQGADYDADND
mmetsp:Transcript_51682/g.46405  ORF Transcript_51682/g.46405 Transcript_51682/m.46405 type:complete len:373 (-) Transcript_51682:187-1305(-)|eukprot:CAMPEP_0201590050 /NCGR_PEP_ID=MMETSP0190_2-20130828/173626_1 /ASSEMBLY_ACC=CAM_ASM_000263 /TAXON_ID=37353 /ORGANISM="Rosalina sp." /LENGTH=372 /DNA_ID=CAMNT_0048045425 /DNA_START=124 /DNA_END=1242 /DNA_ORIENTATION=-